MKKQVHLAVGLPGSGKTTLLTKLSKENLDKGKSVYFIGEDPFRTIPRDGWVFSNLQSEVTIIDLLFRTMGNLESFINKSAQSGGDDYEVVIHLFEPNVQACIKNDLVRGRSKDAKLTIKGMASSWEFSKERIEALSDKVRVVEHEVFEPNSLAVEVAETYKVKSHKGFIYEYVDLSSLSCNWSAVSYDEPSLLVMILREKLGDVSMSEYLRAKSLCCSLEAMFVSDYYSSGSTEYRWSINLVALEKIIDELKKTRN